MVLNKECKSHRMPDHVLLTLGKSTLPEPSGGLLLEKQYAIEEVSIRHQYFTKI